MDLFIKNMVCVRCIMAVRDVLEKLEVPYTAIEMGKVRLPIAPAAEQLQQINSALLHYELELLSNKKAMLTEKIKMLITEMIYTPDTTPVLKFTVHLSTSLQYDYTYLSNIFTETEGNTIERFYITKKIDRVKELLRYENMSIKEIAYLLNYSSTAHLCIQFKKVTGQTPSRFKKQFHGV